MDSKIFIYHFTGASADCRAFLTRCEAGDIKATTSVVVLAEVRALATADSDFRRVTELETFEPDDLKSG